MTIVRRFAPPLALLALCCAFVLVSNVQAQRTFRATLDGAQEPVIGTTATGHGTVVLNAAETSIAVNLTFSGLTSNQTLGHIHGPAPRGSGGGVLFNVGSTGTTSGTFSFNQAVSAGDVANLKAGLLYFNIHTAMFGGGEIRGQIEPDCSGLANGLVSWYRGEGNANDQNSLNNGTLDGASFTTGTVGQGFSLNGNGGRVQLGNPTNLQLQDFTIEAWIKRSSSTIVTNNPAAGVNAGTFIAYGTGGYGFILDEATSKLILTDVGVSFVISPTLTVTGTNYHHVAVTKSGGTVTFYVDGVADTPVAYNPGFVFTSNVAIGARGDANLLNSFFGSVDELSVFSSVLTASQIRAIYNAGAAGKCPACTGTPVGMISWFSGDGDALDSRSRNNATLNGGATFAEGRNGHAFSFDGVDDFVDIPASPSLNSLTTQATFEGWIMPQVTGGQQYIFAHRSPSIAESFTILVESGGNLDLVAGTTTQAAVGFFSPGGTIQFNEWQHIAVTINTTTNTAKAYVNGSQVTFTQFLGSGIGGQLQSTGNNFLGQRQNGLNFFKGLIDEPSIYNRELSANEIAAIANAGISCKCKPGATAAPSGVVGWWGGDGDARDISGNNINGFPQNGAGFALGRVGQGFSLNGGNYVDIGDSPTLEVSNQVTLEAWIKPTDTNSFRQIISKFGSVGNYAYQFGLAPNGALRTDISQTGGPAYEQLTSPNGVITNNAWNHVAVTFNSGATVLYVNGSQVAASALPITTVFNLGNTNVNIGRDPVGSQHFAGIIDEPTIYNRALTADELSSIYNAGIAGKLKQVTQPSSSLRPGGKGNRPDGSIGSVATVGDATLLLPMVSVAGTTQQLNVDPAKLPPLPFFSAGLTYDISTTATFTGPPSVCFKLPSFTVAEFADLAILHLENDNWVNRTAAVNTSPNLCTTSLPSLSPFAIVKLRPTAAEVNVSGRVLTASGQGVSKATVFLTDSNGVTKTARTASFGYFRFDDVRAGETYVVVIGHKRYTFAARVVSVEDEITELDFTALE